MADATAPVGDGCVAGVGEHHDGWRSIALPQCFAFQAATFPLAESAPDAEALVVAKGEFEALATHLATQADLLGFAGRAAFFREEGLGIRLGAQRQVLPLIASRYGRFPCNVGGHPTSVNRRAAVVSDTPSARDAAMSCCSSANVAWVVIDYFDAGFG
jgi:hypothetical protein